MHRARVLQPCGGRKQTRAGCKRLDLVESQDLAFGPIVLSLASLTAFATILSRTRACIVEHFIDVALQVTHTFEDLGTAIGQIFFVA